MTFASIAFKNMRRKFASYLVYFFSVLFSVLIFHIFCTLYYNPIFENFRFGRGKMTTLFRGSAIAVFLFSAVFVIYSGNYFIKTQKKEIAIFSLLGMRKEQIAIMMFMETLFVGALSVLCGVGVGTFSSRFFTKILMRFMAIGTGVTMTIVPQAAMTTLIAFGILFIISGIKAYQTIYRYTLIALLSATRQNEGLPIFHILTAGVSIISLSIAYIISAKMSVDEGGMKLMGPAFLICFLVLIGTFLLFDSLVPWLIAMVKKRKSIYYKTANFISFSQIAFRIKGNAKTLSVISLLTAVTITMMSASYSFFKVLDGDGTKSYAPYSYLAKNITPEQDKRVQKIISDTDEVSLISADQIPLIRVLIQNDAYTIKDQQNGNIAMGATVDAYVLSESRYLKIIKDTKTPVGECSEVRTSFTGGLSDETCYFIDGNVVDDYSKNLIGQKINVKFANMTKKYTITGTSVHKFLGALDCYKHPCVVLTDSRYDEYLKEAKRGLTKADAVSEHDINQIDTFYAYQFDDNMGAARTVDEIDKVIPARFHIGNLPGNISYIGIYRANFVLYGSYVFIGFFLGFLFLLASGSILYYKLITEAQEEASRYEILRKITGIIFVLPFMVGIIHTSFALLCYNRMMGVVGQQISALSYAWRAVLLYVAIWGIFYFLSVRSCYKLVK